MEVEKDIQDVISYSHEFAEKMLNNGKEYYPFGVKIDNSGNLIPVGYKDNETNFPKSQKVISTLTAEFERELNEGKIRTYGVTYDVLVEINDLGDESDAILIDIYHRNSNEIPKYYFPYEWNENDELIFGNSFGIKK